MDKALKAFCAVAVACAGSMVSSPAYAGARDDAAMKKSTAALTDYMSGSYEAALNKLGDAADNCNEGAGCSDATRARLQRDMGIVRAGGMRQHGEAVTAFRTALRLDPSTTIPGPLNTPEIAKAFGEAQAEPPAAAAVAPPQPPPPPPPAPVYTPPPAPVYTPPPAPVVGPPVVPAPPPPPPADPAEEEAAGDDHDGMMGLFGISWYGISEIPLADATPGGSNDAPDLVRGDPFVRQVPAPVLGVRYWLNPQMGIDAGLGLYTSGGSMESARGGQSTTADKQSAFAFMLHGGLPIVFSNHRHLSFQFTPELNFGYATSTVKSEGGGTNLPPDASLSGMRLDLGGRAAAEVHFGFINMPRLALEGSVGLFYSIRSASAECGNAKETDSTSGLTTSSFSNPWDFFRSNVAARYYF